jgi:hypothetical protein
LLAPCAKGIDHDTRDDSHEHENHKQVICKRKAVNRSHHELNSIHMHTATLRTVARVDCGQQDSTDASHEVLRTAKIEDEWDRVEEHVCPRLFMAVFVGVVDQWCSDSFVARSLSEAVI